MVCLSVWHFVLVFFSPFSIAITSLGEERANLSAFRTFVRFVLASSSSWGLGRATVCDCGTPWTFLLPFLVTFASLTLAMCIFYVSLTSHFKLLFIPFLYLFFCLL